MDTPQGTAPPEITVVTTGGTIDKLYFDSLSEYKVGESVVRKLLAIGNVKYPFEIIEALRKDSLDLTDQDRDELYRRVAALKTSRVVMTHGTDTMAYTASAAFGTVSPPKPISKLANRRPRTRREPVAMSAFMCTSETMIGKTACRLKTIERQPKGRQA